LNKLFEKFNSSILKTNIRSLQFIICLINCSIYFSGASGRFNHCVGNVSNNPNHHQQPAERQVKIEFEESEPILAGYSGNSNNRVNGNDDCGENGNEEEEDKVNVDDNYGDGGRSGNLQRQQQLVKISVARLRQILFIALCSLIVLASLAVLFLML
jgi:hypothetical protein